MNLWNYEQKPVNKSKTDPGILDCDGYNNTISCPQLSIFYLKMNPFLPQALYQPYVKAIVRQ